MTLAVARVEGDGRAMGRAQGESFAAGIAVSLEFYRELGRSRHIDIAGATATALRYLDTARARLPNLVAEVEGIAEGAGADFEEIWLLNCLEEVWDLDACTSISHGRFLLHAEQWYAGHREVGVVVAAPDDGPQFVSPTCLGFLPAVGFNASGFAQGIDSLPGEPNPSGIPRVLVSRLALGGRGIEGAIEGACIRDRAGGYAHVLASLERAVTVETGAHEAGIIEGAAAHTNHRLGSGSGDRSASAGSRARLARARELIEQSPPRDLEDCVRILSDHEGEPETICLHEDPIPWASGTVFGMACDLLTGSMLVSAGRPCSSGWHEFTVPGYVKAAGRVG